jgi:phosphate transport system substrate-binding protein
MAAALATLALAGGTLALAGCGDDDDSADTTSGGDVAALSGNILIDGSSTVVPLTSGAAEAFADENSGVEITVATSGTGGGFERFCAGETDISNASRAIKDEEIEACEAAGISYQELRVASDGITVVSGSDVDLGANNITLDQLKAVWETGSQVNNWADIPGGGFNSLPLTLAGPGSQSGTYDFFNEEVLGEDPATGETAVPRQDYTASEDDNVIVRAVTGSEAGMGYFGFTYYEENADSLQALDVDGITPTPETITDGSYPLSRPLFIYVADSSLEKPEVSAFVRYYLENATALAEEQQFVPAPQDALDEALSRVPAA